MDIVAQQSWQDQVYDLLKASGVTQFGYVPDAGHKALINRALGDSDVHAVSLTTEEEGVGLLAGADLGGTFGVMLIQSSGVGNCANLLSLISLGRFRFLALVSMRGDFGEENPWQYPAGQAVEPVLNAMGIKTIRADSQAEVVESVRAGINQAFKGNCATAVLFTQKLLGAKSL